MLEWDERAAFFTELVTGQDYAGCVAAWGLLGVGCALKLLEHQSGLDAVTATEARAAR